MVEETPPLLGVILTELANVMLSVETVKFVGAVTVTSPDVKLTPDNVKLDEVLLVPAAVFAN